MRRTSVSACFGFVVFCIFISPLLISPLALHAQAPAAGTSVVVKMIDAVDSGSDPAGKQYRATVIRAVRDANGVMLSAGSAATVTLAMNGSTWAAQLTSVVINRQPVAVASSSATVTSAAGAAANAVGSVLGGLGRRAAPPASVTAIASGTRVILPPGTTLTFVLAAPAPATAASANTAPAAATSAPVAQPPAASAAPAATPAVSSAPSAASNPAPASGASAGGPVNAMEICFAIVPSPSSAPATMYLTAAFEVPANALGSIPVLEPAFSAYLKATYQAMVGITCQPIWSITDAQSVQKKLTDQRDRGKLKVVNTGWRYQQSAVTQGQDGFDPLATGPGGLDLSQHRLTTYFCTLIAAGGTSISAPPGPISETAYVTPIFQADWDSATVGMAFDVYMRDHYVHDLPLSDLSPRCGAQSPGLQVGLHQGAGVGKLIGHKITVDWTYTPAQAAEAKTAEAAEAAHTAAQQAPTAAANQKYVWCRSDWAGTTGTLMPVGSVMYLSDIFPADMPPPLKPTGKPMPANANGALINRTNALQTSFVAFLQKQYGYKGSGSCSVSDPPTVAGQQNAQKNKQQFEDLAKQNRGQIVETGWKTQ